MGLPHLTQGVRWNRPAPSAWHTFVTMSSEIHGFADPDRLAQRAVDAVLALVRKAATLAHGVLIITTICAIGGFLLGVAALSDGIETVWIVVGGFFAALALGAAFTAVRRLRAVRRVAGALFDEVRSLISGDTRTERTVIETVESADGAEHDGLVVMSQQFSSMQHAIGDRVDQFRNLRIALTAVTSFPGLVAVAIVVSFVFAGLAVLFLIALAL